MAGIFFIIVKKIQCCSIISRQLFWPVVTTVVKLSLFEKADLLNN